jgi:hypothetical protein
MSAAGDVMPGCKRSNRSMARRPARNAAANDNLPPDRRSQLRPDGLQMPVARRRFAASNPEPFRLGPRPLAIAAFAGLILVALCSAFLIGLAAVGVLAIAVAAGEVAHRYLHRRTPLAGPRVAG